MDIYQAISELLAHGKRGAVATVIGATGSTPGKEGAKMLVREDGTTVGTIGGGCTEASVWALAREAIAGDCAVRESFKLTPKQAGEEGLACGGTVEVFVEPIGTSPQVILFGAGHIAGFVAQFCHVVGLDVQVVDDRAQFANSEVFPNASKIVVSDFESCFEKISVTENSYLVIVTRGHRYDQLTLGQAIQTPASYIGLIGSRVKIAHILHQLKREGADEARLAKVHAPVGLDIGARTPEEIALSITAQLVAQRRRRYVKHEDPSRHPLPTPAVPPAPQAAEPSSKG